MSSFFLYSVTIVSFALRCVADEPLLYDYDNYNNGAYGRRPNQTYLSTNIVSPLFQVNSWDQSATDDAPYLFLGLWNPLGGSAGPMIFSTKDFSLIYADWQWPSVHNTRIQKLKGANYLTFYEGMQSDGHSSGNCLFYDSSYRLAYNITTQGVPVSVDMHECEVTDDGSVLISVYNPMEADLSSVGGPVKGELMDSIVQEIDIETGELLWMWRASEHVNITESYQHWKVSEGGWDFFHLNSVQKTAEGNYLISARHFHTLTYINGSTNETIWTLGGVQNDFTDLSNGSATDFGWQHHARFQDDKFTQLTFFDNHGLTTAFDCTDQCSRGRHLEVNHEDLTVRLVKDYFHPVGLASGARGGYTVVDNGNILLSWGVNPAFTEHTPEGDCVLDVQFGLWDPDADGRGGYRAFKMDWVGTPYWNPDIAALPMRTGDTKVAVSWNGATEIHTWQLFTGDSPTTITQRTHEVIKTGFETVMIVVRKQRYARAVAFDDKGNALGKTDVIDLTTGAKSPVFEVLASVQVQDFLSGLYVYLLRIMSFFR